MVKNKPTYITDLTKEILTNTVLLNAWADNSADMEFLKLSVEILSDINLLFSWDCNNVLNLKLAGVLSGNQDFKLKSGMLITIDESYDFPFESHSEYEFIIKELIDAKLLLEIQIKDLVNEGHDLENINQAIRHNKMAQFFHLIDQTKGYESNEFNFLNKFILPNLIERKNEWKQQFINKKTNELFYTNDKVLHPENRENNCLGDDKIEEKKNKQLPEKWYALLYWIELNANGKHPPRNKEGDFIKKQIEEIGRERTNKSGQGFYRSFIEIDLNNTKLLKNIFSDNWKDEIIELSNNDPIVSEYIKIKYPS